MKKYLDLFRIWLHEYFHHPLENIRQANPINPKRLYTNFGNVCKMVPYRPHERAAITETEHGNSDMEPEALMEIVRSCRGNKNIVKAMEASLQETQFTPVKCLLCAFHNNGVPCPVHNMLADGSVVCDKYKYIIIKPAKL